MIDLGLRKRIDLAIKTVAEVVNVHKKDTGQRDIKSSNVMLDSNMDPVLGDFGIGHYVVNLHGFQATRIIFRTCSVFLRLFLFYSVGNLLFAFRVKAVGSHSL